jgi:hypothetical protein
VKAGAIQGGVKRLVRRAGVDIVRYPGKDPAHGRARLLRHLAVDVVFDVGANSGQYGAELRSHGYAGRHRHPVLKVDAQGYERHVLAGAAATLARVAGVQLELSLVPLYEGAMSFDEGLEAMAGAGLELARLDAVFEDPRTGRLLQCDGVFIRDHGA